MGWDGMGCNGVEECVCQPNAYICSISRLSPGQAELSVFSVCSLLACQPVSVLCVLFLTLFPPIPIHDRFSLDTNSSRARRARELGAPVQRFFNFPNPHWCVPLCRCICSLSPSFILEILGMPTPCTCSQYHVRKNALGTSLFLPSYSLTRTCRSTPKLRNHCTFTRASHLCLTLTRIVPRKKKKKTMDKKVRRK